MIRRYPAIYLFAFVLFLAACGGKRSAGDASAPGDTVAYSYKNFKQRDTACGNNPDSACTIVKVEYPQFKGMNALNDSVCHKLISYFAVRAKSSDTSYNQLATDFIGVYHDFKKVQPKSTLYYLVDAKAKVLKQDSALLTVKLSGYTYHGGPHGAEYVAYINWDTKANKYVSLNDLLVENYTDTLNKIGERIFRKNESLADTTRLYNGRTYFFKDNKFSLPDNYLIGPNGITFIYNVYTIKPYAAGKTVLVIPYADIKKLLRPNSIAAQYIK